MTTKAKALAGSIRQVRDRNRPSSRSRSAQRLARRIYAQADTIYLPDANSFAADFPDRSILIVGPEGPAAPRGHAKDDTLDEMRRLPPERQHRPAGTADSSYYDLIQSICQRTVSSDSASEADLHA